MPRKSVHACESEKSIFAERLTKAMKERGENQTTLAEKITTQYVTIQRQTISLYMNGQSKPDTERLAAIARVLDVSADWLLGLSDFSGISENEQTAQSLGLPEEFVRALLFLQKISFNGEYEFLQKVLGSIEFRSTLQVIGRLSHVLPQAKEHPSGIEGSKLFNLAKQLGADVSEKTDGQYAVCPLYTAFSGEVFLAQQRFTEAIYGAACGETEGEEVGEVREE